MLFQECFLHIVQVLKDHILDYIASTNKPWLIRQENAWGDFEGSNEVYISEWEKFLQTEYAHKSVPDWNSKLEDIQEFANEEPSDEPGPSSHSREEWMIFGDLSFTTSDSTEEEQIQHDWHTTSFPSPEQW